AWPRCFGSWTRTAASPTSSTCSTPTRSTCPASSPSRARPMWLACWRAGRPARTAWGPSCGSWTRCSGSRTSSSTATAQVLFYKWPRH
ncbi:unnamed protein product, partial [Prorocentrum cordatum]